MTLVSFSYLGKYRIVGTINDQNLVELVDTWFPNPFYAPGPPPAAPTAAARTLQENMIKLKIEPERHVPVHGRVGTHAEFMAMFSGAKTN